MRITPQQVDDVIGRVGIAALYYDEAVEIMTPGEGAIRDVAFALEPLALADIAESDRTRLRDACQRAIVDPTAFRRDLLGLLLGAIAYDAE